MAVLPRSPSWAHRFCARAELFEQCGDSATARARYRRFADLWADADPEARALARSAAERATASRDTHQRAFE